jgi:hypothetical protein
MHYAGNARHGDTSLGKKHIRVLREEIDSQAKIAEAVRSTVRQMPGSIQQFLVISSGNEISSTMARWARRASSD